MRKYKTFAPHFLKKLTNFRSRLPNQILRVELQLEAALPRTDIDVGKLETRLVDIRGERLLHPDGRTAATDVARQGQQFLHGDEVALLVARHLGGQLQVHFVFAGDDAG